MGLHGVVIHTMGFAPQTGLYSMVHACGRGLPHHILKRSRDIGPNAPTAETPSEACHLATACAVSGPKEPVALAERYPSAFKNSCKPRTSSPCAPRERFLARIEQIRCLAGNDAVAVDGAAVICMPAPDPSCVCKLATFASNSLICA